MLRKVTVIYVREQTFNNERGDIEIENGDVSDWTMICVTEN